MAARDPQESWLASHARIEHYKGSITIEAALSAGYRKGNLHLDLKRGFLTIQNHVLDLPVAAPGLLARMLVVLFMKNGAMRGLFFC